MKNTVLQVGEQLETLWIQLLENQPTVKELFQVLENVPFLRKEVSEKLLERSRDLEPRDANAVLGSVVSYMPELKESAMRIALEKEPTTHKLFDALAFPKLRKKAIALFKVEKLNTYDLFRLMKHVPELREKAWTAYCSEEKTSYLGDIITEVPELRDEAARRMLELYTEPKKWDDRSMRTPFRYVPSLRQKILERCFLHNPEQYSNFLEWVMEVVEDFREQAWKEYTSGKVEHTSFMEVIKRVPALRAKAWALLRINPLGEEDLVRIIEYAPDLRQEVWSLIDLQKFSSSSLSDICRVAPEYKEDVATVLAAREARQANKTAIINEMKAMLR